MVLYQVNPDPIPESDTSTTYAANTPPETVVANNDEFFGDPKLKFTSSVPWPGSTFIIRSASSGHVITLLDGQIMLASPGGRGSIHWKCVENKGWIGFQNVTSGRFLGHDLWGTLCCSGERHQGGKTFVSG